MGSGNQNSHTKSQPSAEFTVLIHSNCEFATLKMSQHTYYLFPNNKSHSQSQNPSFGVWFPRCASRCASRLRCASRCASVDAHRCAKRCASINVCAGSQGGHFGFSGRPNRGFRREANRRRRRRKTRPGGQIGAAGAGKGGQEGKSAPQVPKKEAKSKKRRRRGKFGHCMMVSSSFLSSKLIKKSKGNCTDK